jgi:hypothetical protein
MHELTVRAVAVCSGPMERRQPVAESWRTTDDARPVDARPVDGLINARAGRFDRAG